MSERMITLIERLRFDAVRCEMQFSKGVAANIEEAADEIDRLQRIASEAVTERDRLREQLEHYEWGRKNTQIEMDEREAEVERLSNQLVRCETALKIVSSEDAGFLGQTARAALVPALSDDLHGEQK